MSPLPPARPLPRLRGVDRARFEAEIVPAGLPVVLEGLVSDWPAVAAGRTPAGLRDYLAGLDAGRPVQVFRAAPEVEGRYSYSPDLKGRNHTPGQMGLTALLDEILALADQPRPASVYAGGVPAPLCLPGLAEANSLPLLDPARERLTSLWVGNRSTTATHWDLPQNLACVIAGRRRFVLFPTTQVANLYVGPLDFTLAGQPISLVDVDAPDLERFPRFAEAWAEAEVAELNPGDAVYVPSLWFHNVRSLDPVGAMVNFWWRDGPDWLTTPMFTLFHALLTLRDLPPREREAWRVFFDHYIFQTGGEPMAHIPEDARGLFGPMTPEALARLKAMLARPLTR